MEPYSVGWQTGPAVARAVIDEVKKVICGKDEIVERVMIAILAGGHVLLEDMPGVGKTTLALAFSQAMQLKHKRIQFTPDVMPSDVTGYTIYQKQSERFVFVPGAVMCNLLLADEINRTSSKTQAALLQVMEEGCVTVEQKTYDCPSPFTVIATQNPYGYAGTQLLPESQLDRFLMRLSMGYPDEGSEVSMLRTKIAGYEPEVQPVADEERVKAMQAEVNAVFVHDDLLYYITRLSAATRHDPMISLGASPRGSIALLRTAKAQAFLAGRNYVVPFDVTSVIEPVMCHRLVLSPKAKAAGITERELVRRLCGAVVPPRIDHFGGTR